MNNLMKLEIRFNFDGKFCPGKVSTFLHDTLSENSEYLRGCGGGGTLIHFLCFLLSRQSRTNAISNLFTFCRQCSSYFFVFLRFSFFSIFPLDGRFYSTKLKWKENIWKSNWFSFSANLIVDSLTSVNHPTMWFYVSVSTSRAHSESFFRPE